MLLLLTRYLSLSLGAFTVAAASPAVQNYVNNNNNNNNNLGAEQAVASFFLTVTPVALLLGYYYVFTRRSSLRRKFDDLSRSKILSLSFLVISCGVRSDPADGGRENG